MNVIARLDPELTNFEVAVQHFSHYAYIYIYIYMCVCVCVLNFPLPLLNFMYCCTGFVEEKWICLECEIRYAIKHGPLDQTSVRLLILFSPFPKSHSRLSNNLNRLEGRLIFCSARAQLSGNKFNVVLSF